jgi:hypothetical protein
MLRTRSKNLGKLFRFSKSLPEVRAVQPTTRVRDNARNVFSLRPGAGESLWPKKHVGRKLDKARKLPNLPGGSQAARNPLARLEPAGLGTLTLPLLLHQIPLICHEISPRGFAATLCIKRSSASGSAGVMLGVSATQFAYDASHKALRIPK